MIRGRPTQSTARGSHHKVRSASFSTGGTDAGSWALLVTKIRHPGIIGHHDPGLPVKITPRVPPPPRIMLAHQPRYCLTNGEDRSPMPWSTIIQFSKFLT